MSATSITKIMANVLPVPATAVHTQSTVATVRVLKNGKVQTIPGEIGDASDTQPGSTSGLAEGDELVTGVISNSTSSSASGATTSPFGIGGTRGAVGGAGGAFRAVGGGGGRGG